MFEHVKWYENIFQKIIKCLVSPLKSLHFLLQLEIGHRYEIVVTSGLSLYRYRCRDVIQITGFHGNVPKYEFIYRYVPLI